MQNTVNKESVVTRFMLEIRAHPFISQSSSKWAELRGLKTSWGFGVTLLRIRTSSWLPLLNTFITSQLTTTKQKREAN